jgi:hypothetical protein
VPAARKILEALVVIEKIPPTRPVKETNAVTVVAAD